MLFDSVVDNDVSFVRIHFGDHTVLCLMSPFEPCIYDTVCDMVPNNARMAEIGSFRGGSACIVWHGMQRRSKKATIMCHDLFEPFDVAGNTIDIQKEFDASVHAAGAEVIRVKGDSKTTVAVHTDASLDYVFIDGDHTYEGALADIRNFVPKLKSSGWLLVQDAVPGGEVERALHDAHLDMYTTHFAPPIGHHVVVCHRDPDALRALADAVHAAVQRAEERATSDGVVSIP